VGLGGDIEDVVGSHGAGVNWSGEFDSGQGLVFLAGLQDVEFAVFGSHPDLAVGNEGRSPDTGLGFVLPVLLAGLGVKAMNVTIVFGCVEESVGHAECGDRTSDLFGIPNGLSVWADAENIAHAVAVFGVLTDDSVDQSIGNNGGADDFTGAGVSGLFDGFAVLHAIFGRITIDAPEFFEDVESFVVFDRFWVEGVGESVAATPDDSVLIADLSVSGRGPTGV